MHDINEIRKLVKEAFFLLDKVNYSVMKEHKSLTNHDLTPKQFLLLKTIKTEGKITINELAEKQTLSASSISQLLNKLEKENFIKREVNPNNRREVFVTMDSKGIDLFLEYEKVDDFIIEKYYSKFSLEEVITFRNLVAKLHGIIHDKEGI